MLKTDLNLVWRRIMVLVVLSALAALLCFSLASGQTSGNYIVWLPIVAAARANPIRTGK